VISDRTCALFTSDNIAQNFKKKSVYVKSAALHMPPTLL